MEGCLVVAWTPRRQEQELKQLSTHCLGRGCVLVHRDLTEASEQPFGAGGPDGCFPFAAEENEAQRLSDLPKITVLVRGLTQETIFLTFRLPCLCAAECKQPRGSGHTLNGAIMLHHPQLPILAIPRGLSVMR